MDTSLHTKHRTYWPWTLGVVIMITLALGIVVGDYLRLHKGADKVPGRASHENNPGNPDMTRRNQIPRFYSDRVSFSQFSLPLHSTFLNFSVELDFKPESENGTLIFLGARQNSISDSSRNDDGLTVFLSDGRVGARLIVGGRFVLEDVVHKQHLRLYTWHHLDIRHSGDHFTLTVDRCPSPDLRVRRKIGPKWISPIPTSSVAALYVGGIPNEHFFHGFAGCMAGIRIDDTAYNVFGSTAQNTGVGICLYCADPNRCSDSEVYDNEYLWDRCRQPSSVGIRFVCASLCTEETPHRTARDVDSLSRKAVLFGVGKVPYIGGILKELLEHCWPVNKPLVWSTIVEKTTRLVDNKIAQQESLARQGEIRALRDLIDLYLRIDITQKPYYITVLLSHCIHCYHYINISSHRHHLLPQLWLLSSVHETILKEQHTFRHVLFPKTIAPGSTTRDTNHTLGFKRGHVGTFFDMFDMRERPKRQISSNLSTVANSEDVDADSTFWRERYDSLKAAAYEEWLTWSAMDMVSISEWMGMCYDCEVTASKREMQRWWLTVIDQVTGDKNIFKCES